MPTSYRHRIDKGRTVPFCGPSFFIKAFREYGRKPFKYRNSTDSRLREGHGGDRFNMNTNKTLKLHTDYTKDFYPMLKKFGELQKQIKNSTR